MVGVHPFPSQHGDPTVNAKAYTRRDIQTDFGTTTNETMKWPREADGCRWRPKNVRRPQPGFTLTEMNDIGSNLVTMPLSQDAGKTNWQFKQELGRGMQKRRTGTETGSQLKAVPKFALPMQQDERWDLKTIKNQSVLPQQCGLPGPRVRMSEGAIGEISWKQSIEEVIPSQDAYKCSAETIVRSDYKNKSYEVDGRRYMPAKPVPEFTVRFQNDIGTKEKAKSLNAKELIRSSIPMNEKPMLKNEGYPGDGYDTKSMRLDAAAAAVGPRGFEPFKKTAKTAHEADPAGAGYARCVLPAVGTRVVGAGKPNAYRTTFDIISGGPQLHATGAYEGYPAANSGNVSNGSQWRQEGNSGSVRRRAMGAMGSMPSYDAPPGVEAAWQSRNVGEGSDYKQAANSYSTVGMLAHPH